MTQQTQTWENIQEPLYKITGYNWTSFTLGGVSETRRRGSCGKAFDILKVEVNVSPDLLVFKRFRENFSKLHLGLSQINYLEIV